ncbi:MAG: hypothetical protein LUQ37_08855 [Methanoregulaceae archaeon]|jgi:HSP20 family molecular chaperone IbpA|nr:hypothetical protein [Methanoregulaceae archaeon]
MGIGKKQKNGEKITLVPSTGITETGISFKILCYLPEIPEEAIRIHLDDAQLIIATSNQNETVVQKITVPVDSYICKKKFREGVLEIILERPFKNASG